MSIAGSIAAEYSEKKRTEWVQKLEAAYTAKDWDAVGSLLEEMKRFYFSE